MSGLGVAIYIDEMVYSRFAAALRAQGYDAIGCVETTPINRWLSDHRVVIHLDTIARETQYDTLLWLG